MASQVVSLEGVPRLVRLCRDEKERNHSDGVLVACLVSKFKFTPLVSIPKYSFSTLLVFNFVFAPPFCVMYVRPPILTRCLFCLQAALRKIAANCDSVVLSKRDHRELLEPRLLDSFMLFSTRQESYV